MRPNTNNTNITTTTPSSASNAPVYRSIGLMSPPSATSSSSNAQGMNLMPLAPLGKGALTSSSSNTLPPLSKSSLAPARFETSTGTAKLMIVEPSLGLASQGTATVVASDIPVPLSMYPLSASHCYLKNPSELQSAMEKICQTLNGRLSPASGRIEAEGPNGCRIRVSALRDPVSNAVILEFDRFCGCSFAFRSCFLKALCEASRYLEVDEEEVKSKYNDSLHRLSFWTENNTLSSSSSAAAAVM